MFKMLFISLQLNILLKDNDSEVHKRIIMTTEGHVKNFQRNQIKLCSTNLEACCYNPFGYNHFLIAIKQSIQT